jgi:porphobilinogen synthase
MDFPGIRLRRLRQNAVVRNWVSEYELRPQSWVQPIFITDQNPKACEPIASMPGMFRWGLENVRTHIEQLVNAGIHSVALFPVISDSFKTPDAIRALDDKGLIPKAIRSIKKQFPNIAIISDVALDPYSSEGHDGILHRGDVDNDRTVDVLCQQALLHAKCGATAVAPSDMMDGRVGAIRETLEEAGFKNTLIISYAAKYASCFYGPFRDALQSHPKHGDKKSYQMNPANIDEALREALMDLNEGADIIMVKPGMPYLDVISAVKQELQVPVSAYQVSGEYAMICAAAQNGWLNREQAVLESLLCLQRAGADMIFTYFALEAAQYLQAKNPQ